MIEFEIKPEYYKQIHNAINAVCDNCKLNFTKSGISIKQVDYVNVMMSKIDIPINTFESFKVTKPETIGYELDLFKEGNKKKPIQSMFLNSKVNHKFKIIHEDGITVDDVVTTALITHDIFNDKVSLVDVSEVRKEPTIPMLNMSCTFKLPVLLLKKIVIRGEYIKFEVTKSKLICHGELNWHTNPLTILPTDNATTMYSIDFLKDVVKAIPRTVNEVTMSMNTDYPCTIEFKICDGKVPVKYLLAPRIESD